MTRTFGRVTVGDGGIAVRLILYSLNVKWRKTSLFLSDKLDTSEIVNITIKKKS